MGIVALYDTVSIQSFIYNSNRLRDNRGASLLVEDCFQKYLKMAIRHVVSDETNIRLEWERKIAPAAFIEDATVKCEIIYIGGGNAQIYFENEDLYRSVNTEFSRLLLAEIPGVTVVSACEKFDTDGDFGQVVDTLFRKLQMKKMKQRGMVCAPTMSVTRECGYTRKAAVALNREDGSWLSEEIQQKRERSKAETYVELYKEIENLAGEEGEQWAATVHIDGNAMGEHMNALLQNTDFKDGTEAVRKFSADIHRVYQQSYDNMLQKVGSLLEKTTDTRISAQYKEHLPFRKIYSAGDDVTFVCYGPLAIKAAELYLREIQESSILEVKGEKILLSACAGIAFTKPGYPFYKAYLMAEQCCKNAKTKARKRMEGNCVGSYMDFQMVKGTQQNLISMRKEEYRMENGADMLLRPYAVLDVKKKNSYEMKRDDLNFFYQISDFFGEKDMKHTGIARSKIKDLRNAYSEGEESAKKAVELIRRRYPEKLQKLERMIHEREAGVKTPYIDSDGKVVLWDALEMMDLYISL